MQVNTETTHDNALASDRRHKHAVANAAGVQCGMHDAIVSPIDGRSLTCRGLAQPYRPRMPKHRHVADLEQLKNVQILARQLLLTT